MPGAGDLAVVVVYQRISISVGRVSEHLRIRKEDEEVVFSLIL